MDWLENKLRRFGFVAYWASIYFRNESTNRREIDFPVDRLRTTDTSRLQSERWRHIQLYYVQVVSSYWCGGVMWLRSLRFFSGKISSYTIHFVANSYWCVCERRKRGKSYCNETEAAKMWFPSNDFFFYICRNCRRQIIRSNSIANTKRDCEWN